MQKPAIPKGTRDFGPQQMAKRAFIFENIRSVFEKYGFLPLETPAMENLNVLLGKYGDEGDKLLFKILNSGDYLSDVSHEEFNKGAEDLTQKISKKGLRYDLTVPFARYVVMHQHEITFPFKRYQIQPVWRADRPQKGRYQEFFQCDADVIGTDSLLCEAEIVLMIFEIFSRLGIEGYTIRVNHRQLLMAISEFVGAPGKENDLFVAMDKLDKIGLEKVQQELSVKGFSYQSIESISEIITIQGESKEVLDKFKTLNHLDSGKKALTELETILTLVNNPSIPVKIDVTLARGLSYYTGAIFEVTLDDKSMGSLSGGGRYDDLTGVFGLSDMSGIGFSLGVDRIYDVMDSRGLFPEQALKGTELLIACMDQKGIPHGFELAGKFRESNMKVEVFPDPVKLKKQLNYANKKNIPFVIILGEEELNSKIYTLKDMIKGEQHKLPFQEIMQLLAGNQ